MAEANQTRETRLPWRESIPAWYEIGVGQTSEGLLTFQLRIHQTALGYIMDRYGSDIVVHSRLVGMVTDKFNPSDFTPPRPGDWGFHQALKAAPSDRPEWLVFESLLPRLKPGHRDEEINVINTYALRASLALAFCLLRFFDFDGETDWSESQTMIVNHMTTEHGSSRAGISVVLTPRVFLWLSEQSWVNTPIVFPVVAEIMKRVHSHLWPAERETSWVDRYEMCYHPPQAFSFHGSRRCLRS